MLISLQAQLPQMEKLCCHINAYVLFAHRLDDNTVSCISPIIQVEKSVPVSIGSEAEVWSNALELTMSEPFGASIIRPAWGSLDENTIVSVSVPPAVHRMALSTCVFDFAPAVSASRTTTSDMNAVEGALQCLTPPGSLGSVDVLIVDEATEFSASFFAGVFAPEVPADI